MINPISTKRLVAGVLQLAILTPLSTFSQEIPITTSSKEAKSLFIKGREKSDNLEAAAAAELYDKAIALDPNFAMAYISRSQAGGGFNVARQNREKAAALSGKVSEGERHWIQVVQAIADADRIGYKEHIEALMKLYPKDKRVLTSMGLFTAGAQDYSNSLAYLNKALEVDKNHAPAINQIGYINMTLGNWPDAEKAFKRQLEVLPDSPNAYDSYAEMLLRMGRFEEAIANYQTAYEKNTTFANALTGKGVAYCHKGDFSKAREGYKLQFEKAPSVSFKLISLTNKMNSYLYEGNITEALHAVDEYRTLSQQEKLVPSEITSYSYSGWIYLENGNATEAARNFEMGRTLLSKAELPAATKETFEFNQTFERCALLTRIHEFDAAVSVLEKCRMMVEKRKNPGEERLMYTLASILEREKGNYDKALEAATKNPQDPYTWYQAGLAYEMKNDKENARKTFEKVVNWNWNSFTYGLVRADARKKVGM